MVNLLCESVFLYKWLRQQNQNLNANWLKVSQYDQEMPQSYTAEQPMEHEEEIQNTASHTTARRRFK